MEGHLVTTRCGCKDEGPGKFRHERKCPRNIAAGNTLQRELDRLERTDPAVRKASKALDAVYRNVGGGLSREEIKAIYDPPMQPWEITLGEDETHD